MKAEQYCCPQFFAEGNRGYHGGFHNDGGGYKIIVEHTTGRYSEYTAWDDYAYSAIINLCPWCGSNKPGFQSQV